jgi:hypothetical protein
MMEWVVLVVISHNIKCDVTLLSVRDLTGNNYNIIHGIEE